MADDRPSVDLILRAISEDAADGGFWMLGEQAFARPTRPGSGNGDVRILVDVGHLSRFYLPILFIVLDNAAMYRQPHTDARNNETKLTENQSRGIEFQASA